VRGRDGVEPVDAKARQKTLRLLSNGVYILTSHSNGRCGAATVTWVSQVSFKPPLVMVALQRQSNVFKCLTESRVAALHIVGEGQQEIAHRFFFPTAANNGTINGERVVEGKTAAPILESLPAHIECAVHEIVENGGDHAMVLLRPVEAEFSAAVRPLTMAETPWEYGG
jgi:flavin reductase (DIM6/NTAB) family NADH-FMN oxidoreductase RutF